LRPTTKCRKKAWQLYGNRAERKSVFPFLRIGLTVCTRSGIRRGIRLARWSIWCASCKSRRCRTDLPHEAGCGPLKRLGWSTGFRRRYLCSCQALPVRKPNRNTGLETGMPHRRIRRCRKTNTNSSFPNRWFLASFRNSSRPRCWRRLRVPRRLLPNPRGFPRSKASVAAFANMNSWRSANWPSRLRPARRYRARRIRGRRIRSRCYL